MIWDQKYHVFTNLTLNLIHVRSISREMILFSCIYFMNEFLCDHFFFGGSIAIIRESIQIDEITLRSLRFFHFEANCLGFDSNRRDLVEISSIPALCFSLVTWSVAVRCWLRHRRSPPPANTSCAPRICLGGWLP